MKRVIINKDGNVVFLTFNNFFYPQELINRSIDDFSKVCESRFEGGKLILKPKDKEVDLQTLGYEFYNYLLGLIKG